MDIKLLKNLIEKLHMIPDQDDEKMAMPKSDPMADMEDMAEEGEHEGKKPKGVSIIEIKSLGGDKKPEMADEGEEEDDDYKNSDIFKRLSKKA